LGEENDTGEKLPKGNVAMENAGRFQFWSIFPVDRKAVHQIITGLRGNRKAFFDNIDWMPAIPAPESLPFAISSQTPNKLQFSYVITYCPARILKSPSLPTLPLVLLP
jgi:hypothetical protein